MVRVPKDAPVGLFTAMGCSEARARHLATSGCYVCPQHLTDGAAVGAPINALHVLPLKRDPITRGEYPSRRNDVGAEFARLHKLDVALPPPRATAAAAAAAAPLSGANAELAALMTQVRDLKIENRKLKRALARARVAEPAAGERPNFQYSYRWLTEPDVDDPDRCSAYTSLDVAGYTYWIKVAVASGAAVIFKKLVRGQKTLLDYHDAISVAVSKLFCGPKKWDHFARSATGTGKKAGSVSMNCESAVIATVAALKRTLLRHPDREVVEAGRPACMRGEFSGGTYNVMVVIDGFAFPVEYVSPPELHRLIHSVYKGTAVGQATILMDARFQIMAITDVYCGASGEDTYVKASKAFEKPLESGCWLFKDGDYVMSDKGYRLEEYLETHGLKLCKPTEMARGEMSEAEAAASRRLSQARGHSERVVFRVRRFDIFDGKKVPQANWPMLNVYKDLVCSLVMCLGPLKTQGQLFTLAPAPPAPPPRRPAGVRPHRQPPRCARRATLCGCRPPRPGRHCGAPARTRPSPARTPAPAAGARGSQW